MEYPLADLLSFDDLAEAALSEQILATNEASQPFGLRLTPQDAHMLALHRKETLREEDRIEFTDSVVPKLIERFCRSTFLLQQDFADTIAELIEIFFHTKNECGDALGDEELLDLMFELFEHRCGGSLECLQSRELEAVCKSLRMGEPVRLRESDESALQAGEWEGEEEDEPYEE